MKRNTPLKFHNINREVRSFLRRSGSGPELNQVLEDIDKAMEHYVWLDTNAIEGIKWSECVPKMHEMIKLLEDSNLGETLHMWQYVKLNDEGEIEHLHSESTKLLKQLTDINNG